MLNIIKNPLSVNLMVNSELMTEANIMGGWELLKKEHDHAHGQETHHHHESLYTGLLAHYGGSYNATFTADKTYRYRATYELTHY